MDRLDHQQQANDYFLQARTDVAELVPQTCRTILEIGCGYGTLGRILTERQECSIDGVEINPAAEPYLKRVYRHYWIGDIEKLTLDYGPFYDCILLPDVLEHLNDPWAALTRLSKHLTDEGCIVSSVPNIRNLGILYRLLVKGRWEYEASGILDIGHVRFFTRREICLLFEKSGLEIETWRLNHDNHSGFKGIISQIAGILVPDLKVCQFLVRARKTAHD